nr:ADP-ribosylation factor-like protein 8A [Ipomoea batatas]
MGFLESSPQLGFAVYSSKQEMELFPCRFAECREDSSCEFQLLQVVTVRGHDFPTVGGQSRFRAMWERYCRAYLQYCMWLMAADRDSGSYIENRALHVLLAKHLWDGIPLLVLGNKI